MYEIWLGLNIVFEILKPALAVLVILALLWVALLVYTLRSKGAQWRQVLPAAAVIGIVVAMVVLVLSPTWMASSLSQVTYWVDWAFLGASALGMGALLALVSWPALALLAQKT